ncbi:purine-nucleoside phosphorylase [Bullifex sp.]|uniref:purine-nucleoside phosphorylase n=1 Tax=Bullifex sp. TaxID=2815808 RepID=UPI002A815B9C|nr:purine-nucleoside phosphorylase [Bullifex sp.]MDY4066963.1 purine-nucleoside phosphorylase [Bullifex sp.]
MTCHNSAKKGEIAKSVLMPGDPKRAKFIAENFLEEIKLVNEVRGALAYTGKYKGKEVSVMASGMGDGSMGIYSHELFNEYDVDRIIRVGSAGALSDDLKLGDVIAALSASTDSGYLNHYNFPGVFAPTASAALVKKLIKLDDSIILGPIYSTPVFYCDNEYFEPCKKMGMLAIEMEAAALYANAAELHKDAICLLTISDIIGKEENMTPKEREETFTKMINLALELAISF